MLEDRMLHGIDLSVLTQRELDILSYCDGQEKMGAFGTGSRVHMHQVVANERFYYGQSKMAVPIMNGFADVQREEVT